MSLLPTGLSGGAGELSRGHSQSYAQMKDDSSTPYRTKKELAAHFRVSVSTVEEWGRQRVIPVFKPSPRKNLYHLHRCEEALARFEIREVGR